MLKRDAVVIGAGFYGCEVALALRETGFRRVTIVECGAALLTRASFVNQARVHNGYHYPRSFMTAQRSHDNFSQFCEDYSFAIQFGKKAIYAIAHDSRVAPEQFERFCRGIGAPIRDLGWRKDGLFDPHLIAAAYEVEEFSFDARALAAHLATRLADADVQVMFNCHASVLETCGPNVVVQAGNERIEAEYVFNCTYAGIDQAGVSLSAELKWELAELALIEPPPEIADCAVTVMDGPFFSVMPFPALDCFSLSHVRYTPHQAWNYYPGGDISPAGSRAAAMIRDSARYMPCMSKARFRRSLFDLKVVLARTEDNDGRPILFEQSDEHPRVISILGAKIDNIYDVKSLVIAKRWIR